jgi:hypothetical protein
MANQLQTTRDNLWSLVAGRGLGCWRSPATPAFVGCISGLGRSGAPRRQARHLALILTTVVNRSVGGPALQNIRKSFKLSTVLRWQVLGHL